MKALVISDNSFEDTELAVPYYRLKEEGIEVSLAALHKGTIKGKHGVEMQADLSVADVDPSVYDLLFLPGGKAPAALRQDQRVLDVAAHFVAAGKPVGAICHGPQILAAAGVLKGRTLTGYKGVGPEIKEAGGNYRDEEVVIDGNLVTSREPRDLPAFMREFIKLVRRTRVR